MPPAELANKKDAADLDIDNDITMQRSSRTLIRAKGRLSSRSRLGNQIFCKANPRRKWMQRATLG